MTDEEETFTPDVALELTKSAAWQIFADFLKRKAGELMNEVIQPLESMDDTLKDQHVKGRVAAYLEIAALPDNVVMNSRDLSQEEEEGNE